MNQITFLIILSFLGGLVGTFAMDAIKYVGHKLKLIGGVRMDMLGRWSLGMLKGKFIHTDIHHSEAANNEVLAGWVFHYLTGGLVALAYPLTLALLDLPLNSGHLTNAIIFGLCTSILPWFVVYPAFGKGFFGKLAPKEAKPILTSLVSHTFYGAGIGFVLASAL